MLLAAILLLGSGALLGLALAGRHALGRPVPLALGLAHASLAGAGTVVLALAVFSAARPVAVNTALLCFALGWVGGLFNLLFRKQGERAPGFMIVLHAAVAGLGLILLAVGVA